MFGSRADLQRPLHVTGTGHIMASAGKGKRYLVMFGAVGAALVAFLMFTSFRLKASRVGRASS